MPEMDGVDASILIKQSFVKGDIKSKPFIAAITAYTSEEVEQRVTQSGMEKFLTKPANPHLVYELIRLVIDRREISKV